MAARGSTIHSNAPLIVIVGPTASGKTGIAIKLAEKLHGEIICADSRTIYKGMDIGTAKPTAQEQARVPHWGLDLVEPGKRFTVADFKMYADQKIREIRARGHTPFLVGGTGLYIDAVLFNYKFAGDADLTLRSRLEKLSLEELQEYCLQNNVLLPENTKNKRYLVHAIEHAGRSTSRRTEPIDDSTIVGITTEKAILNAKIAQRSEQLFENGVVEEAIKLGKKYNWEGEAFTGNMYRIVKQYQAGEITREGMKERFEVLDRQLAKRQRTWFKRNTFIRWLPLDEVEDYIKDRLAN